MTLSEIRALAEDIKKDNICDPDSPVVELANATLKLCDENKKMKAALEYFEADGADNQVAKDALIDYDKWRSGK